MSKPNQVVAWDRLAIFSMLWAAAYLFHIVGYEGFRTEYPFTLFTAVAAILVLLRPRMTPLLAILAAAQLTEYWFQSPLRSNHTLIIAAMNATILLLMAQQVIRKGRLFIERQTLYEQLAFVIRWSVPIIYFWAGFHKMNTSFLNPDASCVAIYYHRMTENYAVLPQADFLVLAAIYGTIIIETGFALLFAFRRTQFLAVVIGVGFHFVLGFDNFRDFSWLMMTFYSVFIPDEVFNQLRDQVKTRFQNPERLATLWFATIAVLGIFSIGLLPGMFLWQPQFAPPHVVAIFAIAVIAVWVPILWVWWSQRRTQHPQTLTYQFTIIGVLIVALMFLNGTGPYVGFKTNNSFDMYSNLRVENGSNHLLFPANAQLIQAPNDLVEVLGARIADGGTDDLNYWRDQGFLLPFIQFRYLVYETQPELVSFIRNGGEPQSTTPDTFEEILGSPDSIFLQKFRLYGEVHPDEVTPCGF